MINVIDKVDGFDWRYEPTCWILVAHCSGMSLPLDVSIILLVKLPVVAGCQYHIVSNIASGSWMSVSCC